MRILTPASSVFPVPVGVTGIVLNPLVLVSISSLCGSGCEHEIVLWSLNVFLLCVGIFCWAGESIFSVVFCVSCCCVSGECSHGKCRQLSPGKPAAAASLPSPEPPPVWMEFLTHLPTIVSATVGSSMCTSQWHTGPQLFISSKGLDTVTTNLRGRMVSGSYCVCSFLICC